MLASEISQERRIEQLSEAKRSLQMKFVFMMHGQDQEDEITAPSHSLVKV